MNTKQKTKRRTYGWYKMRAAENAGKNRKSEVAFGNKHLYPSNKLFFLLKKYPTNPFYSSLYKIVGKYEFSAKQLDCIEKDYSANFSSGDKEKHLSIPLNRRGTSPFNSKF